MSIPINEFPDVPFLNYADARTQIRSGDLLMCSGTSMLSSLIQAATGSIWSHIGVIIRWDEIDRIMICESIESIGVRTVPLSFYLNNYDGKEKPYAGRMLIARHSEMRRAHTKTLSKKAFDLMGHKYDAGEIIKIGARIGLSKLISGDKCKIPERDREYICSEYAYELCDSIGLYINRDCRGFIAPVDFAKTEEVNAVFCLS